MSAVVKPVLAPSSVAAVNAAAASFVALTQKLDYLSPEQVDLVRKAYRFADQAHLGQKRNSGEPYITHPPCSGHAMRRVATRYPGTDGRLAARCH